MHTLYHYSSAQKYSVVKEAGFLMPSAPFNSRIQDNEWASYIQRFPFPVARYYTCSFFEPRPAAWIEYGLFDLLMEEFAGGDILLELSIEDNQEMPVIVRDHKYHSPKEYGVSPDIWKKREVRDSRPDLRNKWYESAVPLKLYDLSFICPEVLIPFDVPLACVRIVV